MGTSLVTADHWIDKKKRQSKADGRALKIEEAIRLTYDSMQSHMPYTYGHEELMIRKETKAFHKKCVKDYQRVIQLLTELY